MPVHGRTVRRITGGYPQTVPARSLHYARWRLAGRSARALTEMSLSWIDVGKRSAAHGIHPQQPLRP